MSTKSLIDHYEFTLSNLPAGCYTFLARASSGSMTGSSNPVTITVEDASTMIQKPESKIDDHLQTNTMIKGTMLYVPFNNKTRIQIIDLSGRNIFNNEFYGQGWYDLPNFRSNNSIMIIRTLNDGKQHTIKAVVSN